MGAAVIICYNYLLVQFKGMDQLRMKYSVLVDAGLLSSKVFFIIIVGALEFRGVHSNDSGVYRCTARNSLGTDHAQAILKVLSE